MFIFHVKIFVVKLFFASQYMTFSSTGCFHDRKETIKTRFQLSMGLDIVAHWLHLHTTQELGKSSHKSFGPDSNPILRIYYTNRTVLFLMCAGNEIFYRFLLQLLYDNLLNLNIFPRRIMQIFFKFTLFLGFYKLGWFDPYFGLPFISRRCC